MNHSELFFGFPSGIELIQARKTFLQRTTFQGVSEIIRIGYDSANFCSITPTSTGSLQFSKTLQPSTANGADLGTISTSWSTIYGSNFESNGNMTLIVGNGVGSSLTMQCGGQIVGKIYANTQNMLFVCSGAVPTDQGIMFCIYEPTSPIIGSGTTTLGGTNVALSNAGALDRFKVGDALTIGGETQTITAIVSDISVTTTAWSAARSGTMTIVGGPRLVVRGSGLVGIGIAAPTAFLHLPACTAGYASLRIPNGTVPTTPNDGDIWREDNTNTGLKVRINGVTKTITVS